MNEYEVRIIGKFKYNIRRLHGYTIYRKEYSKITSF